MNKARIKEEAEHFFAWPDPKRRDHVTLTSCLIFAEVIAGMAVDDEREECAKVCEDNADCCNRGSPLHTILSSNAAAIRARGNDA